MNCCKKFITEGGGHYKPKKSKSSKYVSIPHMYGGKGLEVDENLYKQIVIKYDPNNAVIMQSLNLIKKYIIREQLIICGGMAIDFALRLRGSELYSNDEIPDYDFISPQHWIDAYEITQWLTRTGYHDISTINALHPTTMRVRIQSIAVADCTYVPKFVYELIPHLDYHGFRFIHPYYQYLDQHRALSYAYENINFDRPIRPVIISRWAKDMTRYDLLWSKYPLKWDGSGSSDQLIKLDAEKVLPHEFAYGQCIGGFLALQYWIDWAGKKGFKATKSFGSYKSTNAGIVYVVPVDSYKITLYTNNIKELYTQLGKKYKSNSEKFYERFLDKLPRRIILDNKWELIDNTNSWIAAHKFDKFHIANLQVIMLYMLLNFTILSKMENKPNNYIFYAGYMMCRELITFGASNNIAELLPTAEYYGKDIYSDAYLLVKYKQLAKSKNEKMDILQPRNVYDKDLTYRKVPRHYYKFNPEESELFHIDGKQCKKFI